MCFIGHIFPIWLNFKGGKGVAVYLGIITALSFSLAIVFGICWVTLAFIFKYSSVSSIIGALGALLFSIILNNYSLSFFLFIILNLFVSPFLYDKPKKFYSPIRNCFVFFVS